MRSKEIITKSIHRPDDIPNVASLGFYHSEFIITVKLTEISDIELNPF